MANTDAEYRKKRLEQNRDLDTLITEETDGGNVFEKQVYDVMEYIEKEANIERNPVARKILKLKEFGITDEQIKKEYLKHGGSLEDQNAAMANLEKIFVGLVEYINALPNGIVIDKNTGLKDDDESIEQSIEYGILSEDTIVESFDKTFKDTLEEIANTGQSDNEKVSYILENFESIIISYEEFNNDIDNFMNKNKEDTNLSESLKNVFEDSKDIIEQSPYETDMHLFEICNLYVELNDAKKNHSQDYNLILSKIKDFYAKNPDYVGKALPVLNKDGSLNKFEVNKMNEYSEAYQKIIILEHIDSFNGMNKYELKNMEPNERNHMIMCAFAGLKYANDSRENEREIAEESMKMLKGLYPELDLNNEQELAKFFEKISGVKTNFESLNVQDLIEIYSRQLKDATDSYIEEDTDSYVGKKINFANLDLDSSKRKIFDSAMKNYFVGSKINFTGKDEKQYNMMYQEFTINSWIENKDAAIKLRYMALRDTLKKYKDMPPNEYISKKINEIEGNISNFEKEFGKLDVESKKDEFSFEMYKQYFVNAGLTKYLTRDVSEWQEGANYEDLDNTHKKGYIRNILVALEHKDNPDFCITKLALRRLELMNSDRKKFITFDENGGYKINEELILQEYNRMSDHTYADFDELTKSARLRKNEYLLTKLEEYTHLNDEDFLRLENKADKKKSMEQIEERRRESNQERIEQKSKVGETKKRKIPEPRINNLFYYRAEELDDSAVLGVNNANRPREDKKGDQEEADENNATTDASGSEKKSAIEVGNINVSTTQDKPPKFIDRIKNELKNIKDKIKKFIKGEEETLALDAPNDDMTNELNDENNSTGYNINQKFNIDHNLANSGKNLGGKTQGDQESEFGEIEG